MRKICSWLLAIAAAITPVTTVRSALANNDDLVARIRIDADWILSTRTPEGILANGIDKTWVVPYFANIGARGLARAYAATKDERYATAAWSWLGWYQSKMDGNGFVTDYVKDANGVWRSNGQFDSTDSYAATFLTAARDLLAATGDISRIATLKTGIRKAATAIEATTDSDALTRAKPGWGWRYLMDNAEVFEGWRAAADLNAVLGDVAERDRASSRANAIALSIHKMRAPSRGGYDWGTTTSGSRALLSWTQLYPSVVAQAWPIAAGLVTGTEARAMMTRVDLEQPKWDEPYASAIIVDQPGQVMYWPDVARGFLFAGLPQRARRGYDDLEQTANDHARLWPFHPGIAGSLIMLASELSPVDGAPAIRAPQHTPQQPLAYPASSPRRHDNVTVTATVDDPGDLDVVHLCRTEVGGAACVRLGNGPGPVSSGEGDLPKRCAGESVSWWLTVTDGRSVVSTTAVTVRYGGDPALNAALCKPAVKLPR